MRTLTIILLLVVSNLSIAQTTAIPDSQFEQRLIFYGYDVGPPDGLVPTANIDTVTFLSVGGSNIFDLTGIQDFIALEVLSCAGNQLTSLDVTQNTALKSLHCQLNQLTAINVSQNTKLEFLDCGGNLNGSLDVTQNLLLTQLLCVGVQLLTLDVTQNTFLDTLDCSWNQLDSIDLSQNTALTFLNIEYNQLMVLNITQNPLLDYISCGTNLLTTLDVTQNTLVTIFACYYNQLTTLDLSQNIMLKYLSAHNNQLSCLNIKNGNNSNFLYLRTTNNPNLTCIEVDNVAWSTTNWTNIDAQTSFSTNCNNVCSGIPTNINEQNSSNLSLYPNPTSGQINISLEDKTSGSLRVLNSLGQVVLEEGFEAIRELNISLNEPSGLYFLQVEIDGQIITKKVVKE